MKNQFILLVAALVLTGCISRTSPQLPASHPANPAAAQATYPPLAPFLMTETNLVVESSASSGAAETGHEQHGAKAESKPAHQHEQE